MAAGAKGASSGSGRSRGNTAPGTPPPSARTAQLRIVGRPAAANGIGLRAIVTLGSSEEIEVTGALKGPLAHALWQLRGGEDIANWVDAERLLESLLAKAVDTPEPTPRVVIPKKRTAAAR